MAEQLITCPNCGKRFPLSEVAAQQIQDAVDEKVALEEKKLKRQHKKEVQSEVEKRFEERRRDIEDEANKKAEEESHSKLLEKDGKIESLTKQIADLKRSAEQGSQKLQGEVVELELESILRANFPLDVIEPVNPGVKGADVLQRVHSSIGQECGILIWESKNTKSWNDKWISKLKDDQREIKAAAAILVSVALPDTISHFGNIEGVWVTDFHSALGMATVLRESLIQVSVARRAAEGKNEKMEMLYSYLSGTDFKQRVEPIVESFIAMRDDLEREKRAMELAWSKREKQIQKVVRSVAGLYGDMQGIIGATLPKIEYLELPGPSSAEGKE
jgi:hypothetical protein